MSLFILCSRVAKAGNDDISSAQVAHSKRACERQVVLMHRTLVCLKQASIAVYTCKRAHIGVYFHVFVSGLPGLARPLVS